MSEKLAPPAELAGESEDASGTLALAREYRIDSPADEAFVGEIIREAKEKNKRLEEMKQKALVPLKATIAEIQSWFSGPQKALSDVESVLKGKVLEYRKRIETERQAALKKLAEAKTHEEVKEQVAAIAVAQPAPTPGLQTRKIWDYEIVDATQVPDDLWMLNLDAIRRRIHDGARDISGLRIYQREIIAVGSK